MKILIFLLISIPAFSQTYLIANKSGEYYGKQFQNMEKFVTYSGKVSGISNDSIKFNNFIEGWDKFYYPFDENFYNHQFYSNDSLVITVPVDSSKVLRLHTHLFEFILDTTNRNRVIEIYIRDSNTKIPIRSSLYGNINTFQSALSRPLNLIRCLNDCYPIGTNKIDIIIKNNLSESVNDNYVTVTALEITENKLSVIEKSTENFENVLKIKSYLNIVDSLLTEYLKLN